MNSKRCPSKRSALTIAVFLILASQSLNQAVFPQSRPMLAPTPLDDCKPTPRDYEQCAPPTKKEQTAERDVLKQLLAGGNVEFDPKVLPRTVLRGCFIRKLLTSKIEIPKKQIVIVGAIFKGPIDLQEEEIPYRVALVNCEFHDDINIKRSHFSKGLSFAGSSFGSAPYGPGRLDAQSAEIDSDFNMDGCTFKNCMTVFDGMRINGTWRLIDATFLGDASFQGANVDGSFFAGKGDPNPKRNEFHGIANFSTLQVRDDAELGNLAFDGEVVFDDANFRRLSINNSSFKRDVSFKGAKIDELYLDRTQFLDKVHLDGLRFQYISPTSWDQLRSFASSSANYNQEFYLQVEGMFRRLGLAGEAGEVEITQREEVRKRATWYDWNKYASLLEDWLIGYGYHVRNLLPLSLVFLVIGFFTFRREARMQTKKPENAELFANKYSGFWYNIDLFLPIIHLGEAQIWTPRYEYRWGIWYKRFHIIAGSLMVPIGLAVLTGIIK